MTRRRHQALAAAAAGACLALCGCGAGAAPTAAGSSPASAAGTVTGGSGEGFCTSATSFMKHIPSAPVTKHLSTAQARANMGTVLTATLKGYSDLEKQAPAKLRKPLRTIVDIYRNDEKVLRTTGDMAVISQSMVQSDDRGARAFTKVLRYLSASCPPGK